MLKKHEDGTIVDLMPKIETSERSILEWRKPGDHPCDDEGAIEVADGFGGRYAIRADADKFILFLAEDDFAFKTFDTVEKCRRYAECQFQHKVRQLFTKLKGEPQNKTHNFQHS